MIAACRNRQPLPRRFGGQVQVADSYPSTWQPRQKISKLKV